MMGVQGANFVGHLGSEVSGGSNACPLKQRDFSRAEQWNVIEVVKKGEPAQTWP